MDDDTKADAPLTPDEERALREGETEGIILRNRAALRERR